MKTFLLRLGQDVLKMLGCTLREYFTIVLPLSVAGGIIARLLIALIRWEVPTLTSLASNAVGVILTATLMIWVYRANAAIQKLLKSGPDEKQESPSPQPGDLVNPPFRFRREYLEALQKLADDRFGGNLPLMVESSLNSGIFIQTFHDKFKVCVWSDEGQRYLTNEEAEALIKDSVPEVVYRGNAAFKKEGADADGGGTPSAAEGAA